MFAAFGTRPLLKSFGNHPLTTSRVSPRARRRSDDPVRTFFSNWTGFDYGAEGERLVAEGVAQGLRNLAAVSMDDLAAIRSRVEGLVTTGALMMMCWM